MFSQILSKLLEILFYNINILIYIIYFLFFNKLHKNQIYLYKYLYILVLKILNTNHIFWRQNLKFFKKWN